MEKTTSAANRQVIKRILAQEGNNRCADCKTSLHPRWASWNIGILICIRCSGVHRSLGTHISKVRSIDLDTWNDQQLEKLVEFGNKRANAYWEAKLPPNYVPDESKIPSFIKTKYELKRWCGSEADLSSQQTQAPPQMPPRVRSDSPSGINPPSRTASATNFGSFSSARSSAAPSSAPSTAYNTANNSTTNSRAPSSQSSAADLLNLDFSQSSSHSPSTRSMRQPPVQPAAHKDRNDVKKSILSLYSQPVKPTPVQQQQPSQFGQFQQPPSAAASTSSLNSSSFNNNGLNNSGLSSTSSLNNSGLNSSGFNSSSSVNSSSMSNSGMNSGLNSGFGGFTSGNDFDDDISSVWK